MALRGFAISLFILLQLAISSSLRSQSDSCHYSIQGHVFDIVTRQPLISATVQIEGKSTATITNTDGSFQISKICDPEFDIVVSYLGYKILRHHHDFHHPDLEIYLAPDAQIIKGIVIEGEENPAHISTISNSVLGRDELELIKSESLGDALERLPGVSTLKTGQNISTPVIHGLHSDRILVINNNVRHEYQNWSAEHAPGIDLSQIDNIQVIKGAATVRYGPEALGGVVLLNPKNIELGSPLNTALQLTAKSNGRSLKGDFHMSKGYQGLTVQGGGAMLTQGDLHAPDYNLSNTGKKEYNFGGTVRLHLSPQVDARISYSHFNQELGILRGAVNGNLDDLVRALEADIPNETLPFTYDIMTPKQKNAHNLLKADIHFIGTDQAAQFQYSYQNNQHREFDVRRGNAEEIPNIHLKLHSHNFETGWTHPNIGPFAGKLGIQWTYQTNANQPGTNTVPFIPNYSKAEGGIYFIESIGHNNQIWEAGFRFDWYHSNIVGRDPANAIYRNDLEYRNVSAVIGWKRLFEKGFALRSNIGTAWKPPNIAELYRFGRRGTFIEYGLWRYEIDESDQITTDRILTEDDREVRSELGYKWISTAEWKMQTIQAELTGYINYIRNYIYARPAGLSKTVRSTSPYFIYDQKDALFWGVDLSTRIQHSKAFVSDFQASYIWARQINDQDNFSDLPPPNVSYSLSYSSGSGIFGESLFRIGLDYHFKQNQIPRILTLDELLNAADLGINLFLDDASDFDFADSPSGYLLANILWTSKFKNWNLHLQISNVLNQSYRIYTDRIRYFADDAGRNFILGIGYSF